MAKTFTLTSGSYQGRYMQVYCTQTIDIATNTSKIDWTLSSVGGSSNYYSTGATTLKINGTQVYYKARVNWDAKVFPAAKGSVSGTIYIDHNNGGDQSITVSLSTAIYVGAISTYSNTWYLDNIPRQANITSSPDFTDSENPTVYYNNPAGNAVDSLQACISFTGAKDDISYRDISKTGNLYTFYLTEAERNILRSSTPTTNRNVIFFVRTIIGGNYFYSTDTKSLTIVESEATKPVFRAVHLGNDGGNVPSEFSSLRLQGKARGIVKIAAEGRHGTSITNYATTIDGKTYYLSDFTSDAIMKSGQIDANIVITDSRGFKSSIDKTIVSVEAYSKPLVIPIGNENAILCYRSDENGIKVGNSTSVWVKAKRSYYSLSGKNTCVLQWRRRLTSSEAWSDWYELIPKATTSTDEYNALITGGDEAVFKLNESYAIQIRAIDDIGEYDRKDFEIPTQDVALHLGAGGDRIAVGTYCSKNPNMSHTFYSDWKAIFDKGIYIGEDKLPISDFVIERGTDGIWTYEKWASGKAVCWGSKSCGTADVSNGWGDESTHLYESKQGYSETYPSGLFKNPPICIMTPYGDGGAMLETIGDGTASQTPQAYIVRPAPNSALTNTRIEYYVIGRWK